MILKTHRAKCVLSLSKLSLITINYSFRNVLRINSLLIQHDKLTFVVRYLRTGSELIRSTASKVQLSLF